MVLVVPTLSLSLYIYIYMFKSIKTCVCVLKYLYTVHYMHMDLLPPPCSYSTIRVVLFGSTTSIDVPALFLV